jgi:UDP-2-acetamido-2-deoxy-ribo-hexuluronate aminotransferase
MEMSQIQKNIQFNDLKAQQNRIRENLENRIKAVLDHGKYIMGPEIAELEKRLAQFCGVKHCITCASGTDALLMPLMAYGVGPGDAVFTSPFTFISTAEVISLLGATPVYVDINPVTFNIDPLRLKESIENFTEHGSKLKPKGIIPVDLFGQPADYDEIEAIAEEFDLFVLEDAAQSFGAQYKGKRTGSLGDVAATSFFPAKPLGCYGDGGALLCDDDEMADKIKSIRIHGKGSNKYDNIRIGLNGRFDTLQAAILLAKMEIFEQEISMRDAVAERYSQGLKRIVTTPQVKNDRSSVWAQYSIMTNNRDNVLMGLKERGIPSAIYYPKPLHLQDAFKHLGYRHGDFPVSEDCAEQIFSIPMHPYLEEDVQDYIIESIKEVVSSRL